MSDSLASNFQRLILPSPDFINSIFEENFVIYAPKEDVGGDFYWFYKNGAILVIAADGTGHGTTGSFVHLLSHAYLKDIIYADGTTNPSTILRSLHDRLITNRHNQSESETVSLDASIVRIYKDFSELDFCGANSPCYIVRDDNLTILPKSKGSIGGKLMEPKELNCVNFKLQPNDKIYLFSDGYADQFGGIDDKKFSYGRFRELLLDTRKLSMNEQRMRIESEFVSWRGLRKQTDDMMVLGLKIPNKV